MLISVVELFLITESLPFISGMKYTLKIEHCFIFVSEVVSVDCECGDDFGGVWWFPLY